MLNPLLTGMTVSLNYFSQAEYLFLIVNFFNASNEEEIN